ncbi:MAG: DUF5615 family PIN-like protein [Chloroflexota bacterium]
MNILDENIPRNQRELLNSWRIPIRQIGHDISRKGIQDDEIIPFLHQQTRATFFTRDSDFFDRKLCHQRYCLVFMDVGRYEAASFVRRLLRHPDLNTQAKSMGTVIRTSHTGLLVYRLHSGIPLSFHWPK